jgi:hypothetical protein
LTESLIFYGNRFTGRIPQSIGMLDLLQFQAYNNLLSSTIPEEFWNNKRLIDLRLDRNMLAGTLSSSIGNLDRLVDLRLGDNSLEGTLPSELGALTNMSKIRCNLLVLL